jgi:hypothetical protein
VAAERLDASGFGFDSRCFVCDPTNPRGLQVPFFRDGDLVFAEFEFPNEFSGAPTLVHGGATLALLDEAMSWATIALAGKFAYTGETSARFMWPVRVGRRYRVQAGVTAQDERRITTGGERPGHEGPGVRQRDGDDAGPRRRAGPGRDRRGRVPGRRHVRARRGAAGELSQARARSAGK